MCLTENELDISIITVTKNSELYINETIESVINQKLESYEHLIIDALSEDRTLEIARSFNNPHIRIISESDNGIYDAMNKGIRNASGKYILILNSDDRLYEKNLRSLIEKYKNQYDRKIIFCSGRFIGTNKVKKSSFEKLGYRMTIFHPGTIISKEFYYQHGLYSDQYKISSDYWYFLKVKMEKLLTRADFVYENTILTEMRLGGASSNKNKTAEENYKIHSEFLNPLIAYLIFVIRIFKYALQNKIK
jgi:glycosyltransferase involved in cell wall biosynthesis